MDKKEKRRSTILRGLSFLGLVLCWILTLGTSAPPDRPYVFDAQDSGGVVNVTIWEGEHLAGIPDGTFEPSVNRFEIQSWDTQETLLVVDCTAGSKVINRFRYNGQYLVLNDRIYLMPRKTLDGGDVVDSLGDGGVGDEYHHCVSAYGPTVIWLDDWYFKGHNKLIGHTPDGASGWADYWVEQEEDEPESSCMFN